MVINQAVTDSEATARGVAESSPIHCLVQKLEDILGPELTTLIAGTNDAHILDGWKNQSATPEPREEESLRNTFPIAQVLFLHEGSRQVVRAWFLGQNPHLYGRAPALFVAKDPDTVMAAAYAYITGDYE